MRGEHTPAWAVAGARRRHDLRRVALPTGPTSQVSHDLREWAPVEPWFVYMARCADTTIYVGIARDVASRIAAHDAGRGARYTRGRGPLEVLATRRCASKGDALRLELALKRLTRSEKIAIAGSKRRLAVLARGLRVGSAGSGSKQRGSPVRTTAAITRGRS